MSHLILINTSPTWQLHDIAAQATRKGATPEQLAALRQFSCIASDEHMRQIFHTLLPLYFFHYRPTVGEPLVAPITFSATAFTHGLGLLHEYSRVERLKELTMPTLVLGGQDDFIQPASQSERLHQGLPNSELVLFQQSGHFPFLEEPERFFSTVRQWLLRTAP